MDSWIKARLFRLVGTGTVMLVAVAGLMIPAAHATIDASRSVFIVE
jgi:hypothetical protein